MKKTNLKKEDKNSTSLLKGVLTGLVGFGLGIGAKILYDEYKDKDKKKNLYNYYINIYYKVYLFIKGKKFFKI